MQRARTVDSFVIWVLSVVLAGVFLLVGIPKLFDGDTVGFQAAAMRGFPSWARQLVGLAEVLGGIGLLVPPVATLAALLLAVLMVGATLWQYASGEPGLFVPVLVMALLLVVAWRRNPRVLRERYQGFSATPHPLLREGVIAGVIGATVIAAWFLLIDGLAGRPFYTPATLGRALLGVVGPTPPLAGMPTYVLAYTVFHYAAFMIVGLVFALVVALARREPAILIGFGVLFAVTEVGVLGLVALLDAGSPLGRWAWLQIMAANVLAALAMGFYFWRRHSEIADELRHAFDEPKFEPPAWREPADAAPPYASPSAPAGTSSRGP